MPILGPDELFYNVSRLARDFHGQTVALLAGTDVPVAVHPVSSSGIYGRAIAVRLYPGVDVTMRFDTAISNTHSGAMLKADEYHTFDLQPGTKTIFLLANAVDSVHLTYFIGHRS